MNTLGYIGLLSHFYPGGAHVNLGRDDGQALIALLVPLLEERAEDSRRIKLDFGCCQLLAGFCQEVLAWAYTNGRYSVEELNYRLIFLDMDAASTALWHEVKGRVKAQVAAGNG